MKKALFILLVLMLTVLVSCSGSNNDDTQNTTHTHSYGEWVVTLKDTCLTGGRKEQKCSCGHTVSEFIEAKGHTPNAQNICTVCNKMCVPMNEEEKKAADSVYYINNRYVDYDENEKRYEISFKLENIDKESIVAPTFIDVRIENNNKVVVYENTILVKTSDYQGWKAKVYINDSEITKDVVEEGRVYMTVYNPDYFSFSEVDYSAFHLPLKDITLIMPAVPKIYNHYYYDGELRSSVEITSISYKMVGENKAEIYFAGTKTYDEEGNNYSAICCVGYKIYDSENFVVSSGTLFTDNLCVGDKFKDEVITVYDMKPGETYTLELLDVK